MQSMMNIFGSRVAFFLAISIFTFASLAGAAPSREELISGNPQVVPIEGMATMVDIGAKACIPCKMMIPVIEESSKKYEGKAAIVFIDIWKNPDEAKKFGIRSIPTQIFYDKNGKEFRRHEGFLNQKSLDIMMQQMGVE